MVRRAKRVVPTTVAEVEAEVAAEVAEVAVVATVDEVEARVATEVEQASPAPAAPEMIEVQPKYGRMVEPFQRILIPEGQKTPVRLTNWVQVQIDKGMLIRC